MRILLESDHPCHSSTRIERALARYAPTGVTLVHREAEADVVLLHVGGRFDHVSRHVADLRLRGKQYVILQLVLRACSHPRTADWLPLWKDALFVWSYYDLLDEMRIDRVSPEGVVFYYSPLGVDPTIFRPTGGPRPYLIFVEGDNPERDSVIEINRACRRTGAKFVHVGPKLLDHPGRIEHRENVSDDELVGLYNSCQFVSGLRTIEGFELCAAEGLLCGARPILFDRRDQRGWFGVFAEYMPENHAHIANWLGEFLTEGARPVSDVELAAARYAFSWERIAQGFWERVLAA